MDYIDRVEDRHDLGDQPRVIVRHEKEGREHYHVVWSRVDVENEKAKEIAFDKMYHMIDVRRYALDHGLTLSDGFYNEKHGQQKSFQELEQYRQTGLSNEQVQKQVTECWKCSDNALTFVNALAEKGYMLARGDSRDYLIVDFYGGFRTIAKAIDNRAVKTKVIRKLLETDFPKESLPHLTDAKKVVAAFRKEIEEFMKPDHEDKARFAEEKKELKQT